MRNPHRNRGDIAIGAMLMVIGVALVLGRADIVRWDDRFTLWPVILIGIGVARLLQSPPGGPRQGLLFLIGGAWLFAAEANWISLHDTWPWVIIAFGLAIAMNGVGARRAAVEPVSGLDPADGADTTKKKHKHPRVPALTGLAVLGIWIAIFVAVKTSGIGINGIILADGRSDLNVAAVMGKSQHTSRSTDFRRASMTTIMGKAELDLREARIAPGVEAVVDVFGLMGTPVIRVPEDWVVDVSALPIMGRVKDERLTPRPEAEAERTEPQSRLVLRGVVVMGGVVITS